VGESPEVVAAEHFTHEIKVHPHMLRHDAGQDTRALQMSASRSCGAPTSEGRADVSDDEWAIRVATQCPRTVEQGLSGRGDAHTIVDQNGLRRGGGARP
jgi:hypothetical protein